MWPKEQAVEEQVVESEEQELGSQGQVFGSEEQEKRLEDQIVRLEEQVEIPEERLVVSTDQVVEFEEQLVELKEQVMGSDEHEMESVEQVMGSEGQVVDEGLKKQTSGTNGQNTNKGPVVAGDIVWALKGRTTWYPALICSIEEVPDNLKKTFEKKGKKYIAWWYGDCLYSLTGKAERLGETKKDTVRASKSVKINKLYNDALNDVLCMKYSKF